MPWSVLIPVGKREAEAEADAEADPALLYSYGYPYAYHGYAAPYAYGYGYPYGAYMVGQLSYISALLEKFWRISLYVTDATIYISKLFVTQSLVI